jgi:hypothetical protein
MASVEATTGLPEEVDALEVECESTVVVLTVHNRGRATRAAAAVIRLTIDPDGPSASGTTSDEGVVTFTIKNVEADTITFDLVPTDAHRTMAGQGQFAVGTNNTHHIETDLGSEIDAVVILDGEDTEATENVVQWVNLPAEAPWVERSAATSLDRLSRRVRVLVKLKHPSAETVSVTMRAVDGNVAYTDSEVTRNAGYATKPANLGTAVETTTEANGKQVLDDEFHVTAAGKDKFEFVATDVYGNTVVSAHQVETRRQIWMQPLAMTNERISVAESLETLTSEYAKHGITVTVLEQREMGYIPNVSMVDLDALKLAARAGMSEATDVYTPHLITMVYADHLAEPEEALRIQGNVTAGPDADPQILLTGRLWEGLDATDWFVSARFTPALSEQRRVELEEQQEALYQQIDDLQPRREEIAERREELAPEYALLSEQWTAAKQGNPEAPKPERMLAIELEAQQLTERGEVLDQEEDDLNAQEEELRIALDGEPVDITKDRCTPLAPTAEPEADYHSRVRVELADLVEDATIGELRLTYQKLGYFRGGTSIKGKCLTAISTRRREEVKNTGVQNQVMIHELGHQTRMVPTLAPDASDPLAASDLDRHATSYEQRGHQGPHCHAGVVLAASFRGVDGATCTMFGATSAPSAFCPSCATALKKQDLSAGYPRFWV